MTNYPSISTFAERFRRFHFDKPEPESFSVWYQNNNSVGNRYVDWKGIWAVREASEEDTVLTMDELYNRISYGVCDWHHLFEGINYGLIIGPKTLAALEECLEILHTDIAPEDDGIKVLHVNHLGGRNMLDKPTFHSWNLTDKLGKIMSSAFFEDRKDRTLYSEEYIYIFKSHSGWSRSC